jgi:hypothetical protein
MQFAMEGRFDITQCLLMINGVCLVRPCYAPAVEWLGHIVLPCSVFLSSSVSVYCLGNCCKHLTYWYIVRKCSSSSMVMARWLLAVLSLNIFSVSVHYLSNSYTDSTQIWHIDMCRSSSNLVMVWWFLTELNVEKKKKFLVLVHYLPQQLYAFNSNIMYGYVIRMCRSSSNLVMVRWFWTNIILFNLKKFEIFSFRTLTFVEMYVYCSCMRLKSHVQIFN